MKKELLKKAAAGVAQYPQYAGYFDNHLLVRIKKDIKTKMGLAFSKGETALAVFDEAGCLAWSIKNNVATLISSKDAEIIQ